MSKVLSVTTLENNLSGSNAIYQRGGHLNLRYPRDGSPYIGGLPRPPQSPILITPNSFRKGGRRVKWSDKWTEKDAQDCRSILEDVTHYEVGQYSDDEGADANGSSSGGSSSSRSADAKGKDIDGTRSPNKDKKKSTRRRRSKDEGDSTKATSDVTDPLVVKNGEGDKSNPNGDDRTCRQCEDCVIM